MALELISLTPDKQFFNELIKLNNDGDVIFQQYPERMGMRNNHPFIFSIKIDSLSFDFIVGLYNSYFNGITFASPMIIKNRRVIDSHIALKWEGLSAGELEYFNLLSRIHATQLSEIIDHGEKVKISQKRENVDNVIILLDEPENAFHPEWQRLFLNNYINFIKK